MQQEDRSLELADKTRHIMKNYKEVLSMKDKIKKGIRTALYYLNLPFMLIRALMVLPIIGIFHLACKHCNLVVTSEQETAILDCITTNMTRYFGILGGLLYAMDRYWFGKKDPLQPRTATQRYLDFGKKNRELEE